MSLASLIRGAAGSFVLNAGAKLLMLAAAVLLARRLGPEGFGVYASAVAAALLLAMLGALGLPTLRVRLVASYQANAQWSLMRGLVTASERLVLGSTTLIALAGAAICFWLGTLQAAAFAAAMALVPLVALNGLRSGALRGLHRVVLAQVPECLVMPGLFVLLLVLSSPSLSPEAAIAFRIAATALAFLIGAALLRRHFPREARQAAPEYAARAWAASAGPLFCIGVLSLVNLQADVLMLALLRGPEAAGVYQAAARGAELVAFSLLVANFALQPLISRLHALGDLRELQRVVTLTARATLLVALPVAFALALFAAPILRALFGAPFERGALCLVILCAAQVVNAGIGSVDHLLNMTGHERDTALGMALGAAANVALNAALIPLWGIEGAAFATASSLVLWNLALSRKVRLRLGIASGAFGRGRLKHVAV